MSIVESSFQAASWCRNPHLQTLWPYWFRRSPSPTYRRERLELDDGDFLDLDWYDSLPHSPLVVVLHGLEGCSGSHYVRGLVDTLAHHGVRSVIMHQRGCSGTPNRLARGYHAGETLDFDAVLQRLRQREPDTALAAVGFSMGGNILLKWMGEHPATDMIETAVAVSVPFSLAEGVRRMEQGISRLYQWRLLSLMRRSINTKFDAMRAPIDFKDVSRIRNFFEFDDRVTAPLHGFAGAEDYYRRCSSRPFLFSIDVDTLILHALDDPMLTPAAVPTEADISGTIRLELSRTGGHVGFVHGPLWRPRYWLDQRITRHLCRKLNGTYT